MGIPAAEVADDARLWAGAVGRGGAHLLDFFWDAGRPATYFYA